MQHSLNFQPQRLNILDLADQTVHLEILWLQFKPNFALKRLQDHEYMNVKYGNAFISTTKQRYMVEHNSVLTHSPMNYFH